MSHLQVRRASLAAAVLGCAAFAGLAHAGTIVEFTFNGGITGSTGERIDSVRVELFDEAAPATVANFLQYVNSAVPESNYDNTFIHRSVPGFIVQGGGFYPHLDATGSLIDALPGLTTFAPVVNEFSPSRSNVRGTIAMAKLGGDPNSATSQWFFNLADNSSNLDNQNGGFTVFGQVLGDGMSLIDAIAGVGVYDLSPYYGFTFTDVPLFNNGSTLVMVTNVAVVPEPGSLGLAGLGAAALLCRKRRSA